jgi:hypothetical protein
MKQRVPLTEQGRKRKSMTEENVASSEVEASIKKKPAKRVRKVKEEKETTPESIKDEDEGLSDAPTPAAFNSDDEYAAKEV